MNSKSKKYAKYHFILIWLGIGLVYFLTSTNFSKVNITKDYSCYLKPSTDKVDGGTSWTNINKENGGICFDYMLTEKARYPFAGVKLSPRKGNFQFSGYDYLEYKLKPDTAKTIHVFIYFMFNDSVELKVRSEINTKLGQTIYQVPLNSFDFPSWYLKGKNLSRNEFEDLTINEGHALRIGHNIFLPRNKQETICVQSIHLGAYNGMPVFISMLIFVLGSGAHFLAKKLKNVRIEISYKPAEVNSIDYDKIEQKEIESIIKVIGEHYMNSSLTLRTIRKLVKIPENKVSLLIRNELRQCKNTHNSTVTF